MPAISPERAARAIALTSVVAKAKIRNAGLTPVWIGGQDRFWYVRQADEERALCIVDASTAARQEVGMGAIAAGIADASGTAPAPDSIAVKAIAADGGVIVATVESPAGSYTCRLDADACKAVPLASAAKQVAGRLVSPDGARAVFVRDHNLWVTEMATGQERPLTMDGTDGHGFGELSDQTDFHTLGRLRQGLPSPMSLVRWCPDSRRLFLPRIDQRHLAPYPFFESAPQDGSVRPKVWNLRMPMLGEPPATTEWFVVDADSARLVRLDFPAAKVSHERTVQRCWWREAGRRLFVLAQTDDMEALSLFVADTETGAVRTIVEDASLGRRVYFAGLYGTPPVRISQDGRQAVMPSMRDGWMHLYLYDTGSGQISNRITSGEWNVREILAWDEAARTITFTAAGREPGSPYNRFVYRIGLDGTGLRLLTPEPGDHLVLDPTTESPGFDGAPIFQALSPSGRYMVYSTSPIASPPVWSIRRCDDASLVADFEHADASALFADGYRPPEEVMAKAADGVSDLFGLVYRPSDYDPAAKYAVLHAQYCSPHVAVTPRNFVQAATGVIDQTNAAATAELGFIVVVVDARGTPGRSAAFSRPHDDYLNDMGLADHIAFIREVARRDPALDLTRVAIAGGSFGGWTALRGMLAFPDFYTAGIAAAAPGTFHAMYVAPGLTFAQGAPDYGPTGGSRPGPSDVPLNFRSIDNIAQVDRLKGKLLLFAGEHDENVLPSSTLQFYDAAMKRDKDVELVYVLNATHGAAYYSYCLRRGWNFLLRHLNGTELPAGVFIPSLLDGRR